MKWVAVDFGTSNIKASVLDKGSKPVRLSYPMGDHETTNLSSVAIMTDSDQVIIGDYATYLGIINPEMKNLDWLKSSKKTLIAKAFFETIKQAAIKHYSNTEIGIVLLYCDILDKELECIAKNVFDKVKTMQIGNVVKKHLFPNSAKTLLIADFGNNAFKTIVCDKDKCFYSKNEKLGFSYIDMLCLIDCNDLSTHSSTEIALLSQMIQRIKIYANNGEKIILPYNLSAKAISFENSFEKEITTFHYQCFEECSNVLKGISKSWKDIDEVIFIGGGAHSNIINATFEKYMQSYCSIESYNKKNHGFDVQYAATHFAIQMPEVQNEGNVTVSKGINYV